MLWICVSIAGTSAAVGLSPADCFSKRKNFSYRLGRNLVLSESGGVFDTVSGGEISDLPRGFAGRDTDSLIAHFLFCQL